MASKIYSCLLQIDLLVMHHINFVGFGTPMNYGCSNVPTLLCRMLFILEALLIFIYPSLWSFGCCLFLLSLCHCFFIYLLELVACFFVLMHLRRFILISIACRPRFLSIFVVFFFFLFLLLFSFSFLFCYDSTHNPSGSDHCVTA